MSPATLHRPAPSGWEAKRRAYVQQNVPPTSVMQRRVQVAPVARAKRITVLREHLVDSLQLLVDDGLLVDSLQRRRLDTIQVGLLTTACAAAILGVVELAVTADNDVVAAAVVRRALVNALLQSGVLVADGDATDRLLEAVYQASEDVMTSLRDL